MKQKTIWLAAMALCLVSFNASASRGNSAHGDTNCSQRPKSSFVQLPEKTQERLAMVLLPKAKPQHSSAVDTSQSDGGNGVN